MGTDRFTYRRAIQEGCFYQLPLMAEDAFRKAADQRTSLGGFGFAVKWETFDREGLLPPVAYSKGHVPDELLLHGLAVGEVVLRDEVGYQQWGGDNGLRPLYGHWQLISLAGVAQLLNGQSGLLALAGEGLDALRADRERMATGYVSEGYAERVTEGDRDLELLLTRTQSLFMPVVRKGRYLAARIFDADGNLTGEGTDAWVFRQRSQFDYAQALEECGRAADDLKKMYEWLLERAERVDPLHAVRTLIDRIDRSHLEQLRGEAMRAQDLLDAANVLRFWYLGITGTDLQPEYHEQRHFGPTQAELNKRLYGYEEITGNRAALPGILEQFGIYPWRVGLVTEGPSDIAMLEAIVEQKAGTGFDELGIAPVSMGGADQTRKKQPLPTQTKRLLGALRRYPNYFLVVFDREGSAPQLVDELERFKPGFQPFPESYVLEPNPARGREAGSNGRKDDRYRPPDRPEAHIWEVDIEADNFTSAEICTVISDLAAADERVKAFDLTADDLDDDPRRATMGIASIAVKLAEERDFRLSKVQLAQALGEYAVTHPELNPGEERPVMAVAEHLFRLTVAHRQLRGKLRAG